MPALTSTIKRSIVYPDEMNSNKRRKVVDSAAAAAAADDDDVTAAAAASVAMMEYHFQLNSDIGRCSFLQGDQKTALLFYGRALALRSSLLVALSGEESEERQQKTANIFFDIGIIYLSSYQTYLQYKGIVNTSSDFTKKNQECWRSSLKAFTVCLEMRREQFDLCSASSSLTTVLYWLAILQEEMGNFSDALEYINEAVGLATSCCDEESESSNNDYNQKSTDKNGTLFNNNNSNNNIISNLPPSSSYSSFSATVSFFELWVTLGRIQVALDQTHDARSSFEEAGRVLVRNQQLLNHQNQDFVSMYAYLTQSRGNRLQTSVDLNETRSFFSRFEAQPICASLIRGDNAAAASA